MIGKGASAYWEDVGKRSQGQISTETDALQHYPYGFASRFEDERRATNTEEIRSASHAACCSLARMRLSHQGETIATNLMAQVAATGIFQSQFQYQSC